MKSAIIVGGGHNGLVCAFYLARAGLDVTVVEKRDVVGGAAVTEEFYPGFRNSTASYTVSLLNPKIIADMALHGHGLRIVERKAGNFLPTADGRYLLMGAGRDRAEVAKFSAADAARLEDYGQRLNAVADVLRELVLQTPPNLGEGGWLAALPQMLKAGALGRRLSLLDMTARRDLLALLTQSAGEWLDSWFESDPVKALFGFDGIVGNYDSPYAQGSAYVLLHHVFGEVNGRRGAWGHAIGGMGAITQAMARAARQAGTRILTGSGAAQILVENGCAVGVELDSGRQLRADAVAANVGPKLLYERLMPPGALDKDFSEHIRRFRCGSGTFRMNVALSALPRFSALPQAGAHLTAGIVIAPTLRYMEQAHADARRTGAAERPIVEMLIPSTLDDSLAPAGRHVASLFCQHVDPDTALERRDELAQRMIDTVDRWAPGFRQLVLGYEAMLPCDLEQRFGLVRGDIFHGAMHAGQLFSARPLLGHGHYRGPLPGLYMCGAGTHPGGGVTGAPGHNAAREMLADARRRFPG